MAHVRDHRASPAADAWHSARACLGPDGLLSVIMPAFNLERAIAANIEHVHALFAGHLPFEIVPVDDGSADGTADEIRRAAAAHPDTVRPVLLPANVGKGGALARGVEHSRGSHVLLLDGDLDLDPLFAGRFFDVMRDEQAAVVIGSKRHPESQIDYPWNRRVTSWFYYTFVKLLVGLPVTDTQTGMKLFERSALQWAIDRMLVKRFAFDLEILSIAHEKGFRVREAPIRMQFGDKRGCLTWANARTVLVDTLAIFYRLRVLRYYQSVERHRMPEPPPLVSVVIACPAPSAYLTEALQALSRQTYTAFEVLVLPDDPVAGDASWPAGVRVLPTGRLRPAEKRNLGIGEARGSIVAFLDDDAYPVPSWLERAVPHFENPEVAAVGGPAITPPNDPEMARLGGRVYANPLVSGGCRHRYVSERVRAVDDFPSCNLMVRTEVLRRLGGFRTDFWPGEDTILCADIVHRLGLRILYEPWAVAYHHRRPLFAPHLRQIGRYARHRGYFARHFPDTSRRFGYLVPSLWVIGLVAGALASLVAVWARILYLWVVGLYLLLTLLMSFHPRPRAWLLTWLGVMATHVVYGVRFVQGVLSPEMPGEVRPFDHPSEAPPSAAAPQPGGST
jgi:glycosyltransferase involved in cell wall biosynthesis